MSRELKRDSIMKINIWIRHDSLDDLAYFLSDDFSWDREMKIDILYSFPSNGGANDFLSVSLNYKEYKKLEEDKKAADAKILVWQGKFKAADAKNAAPTAAASGVKFFFAISFDHMNNLLQLGFS